MARVGENEGYPLDELDILEFEVPILAGGADGIEVLVEHLDMVLREGFHARDELRGLYAAAQLVSKRLVSPVSPSSPVDSHIIADFQDI